jgi:acetylornithine deacetylase
MGKWLPQFPSFPIGGIFLEPTELDIGVSHKGFAWYEVEVSGKSSHGSKPDEGIDAIFPLVAALGELKDIQSDLLTHEAHPLLGHASLHVGLIAGGTALNIIPSRSLLQWERRTLPGESPRDIDFEMDRVIQAIRNIPGNHRIKGRRILMRSPYEISGAAPIVNKLRSASPKSRLRGFPFWADSALAGAAGIPSVLFGPAGHGAHGTDEWVSLKSLVDLYEILRNFVMAFDAGGRPK